jgi:hypothetical protein
VKGRGIKIDHKLVVWRKIGKKVYREQIIMEKIMGVPYGRQKISRNKEESSKICQE